MSVIEIKVPVIGESVTEVTLSQWLKEDGDFVAIDESICEFESDKATLELPAEKSGRLIYVAAEGDDLEIGAVVAKIDTSVAGPAKESAPTKSKSEPEVKPEEPAAPAKTSHAKNHPSPAAGKILAEKGIDPKTVEGTGRDGRITKGDAEKAAPKAKPAAAAPAQVKSVDAFSRNTHTKKMSRMRRTIAKRLVSAKNETAMLTTFNEVDMSAIFKLRKTYQEDFVEKYG